MIFATAFTAALVGLLAATSEAASNSRTAEVPFTRPRIFVLSDIANEPDDAQSLVRLLLYSNQLQIEGLVATTSYHLNASTRPEEMLDIINAYGEVLQNLKIHEGGWPDRGHLVDRVKSGLPVFGMQGVGTGKDSAGSDLLISAVDAAEDDLWVSVWGGSSVLAQALHKVRETRSAAEVDRFVQKVRVYTISDQDDTGTWIRRNFPQLFYISSVHRAMHYTLAAWNGISGEHSNNYEGGPDSSVISAEWLKSNIQSVSALGKMYPDVEYLMEGDTPSFLYLIPTGLSDPTRPEWGSWGGRYGPVNFMEGHHADTFDTVIGKDGKLHTSNTATVWRWRPAFQNDFAARMRWTASRKYGDANHAPVAIVNGSQGLSPIELDMALGETVYLDASGSYDPDSGDTLSYRWWQYLEASALPAPELSITGADSASVEIRLPPTDACKKHYRYQYGDGDSLIRDLHIILEVNDGEITRYRRVVIHIDIPGGKLGGVQRPPDHNAKPRQHEEL